MPNLQLFGYVGLAVSFSAAVVAPLFAGCGSSTNGGNGGNGGNGAQGVGGHAVGGHGGHGVVVGGAGVGGSVDCAPLIADDSAPEVAVRFVNHTNADVYIGSVPGSCSYDPSPFVIKDPQGEVLTLQPASSCPRYCATETCTATMTCTSTSTCPPHSVTRIAPQATLEQFWSGTVVTSRTVPGSCYAGNCTSAVTCDAWVKPPAVPLTVVGTVWTGMKCETGACECVDDGSGTCTAAYGATDGTPVEATATLAPGATTVDVVFQ